jgi:hypothetical protein
MRASVPTSIHRDLSSLRDLGEWTVVSLRESERGEIADRQASRERRQSVGDARRQRTKREREDDDGDAEQLSRNDVDLPAYRDRATHAMLGKVERDFCSRVPKPHHEHAAAVESFRRSCIHCYG